MLQNAALIFSQHWSIYQKIILHNYMHHAELGKKTAAVFREFPQKLRILDIGCGDAAALLPVYKKHLLHLIQVMISHHRHFNWLLLI
jgi:tRNA1(Val) A37 N6-methylase TrmN6